LSKDQLHGSFPRSVFVWDVIVSEHEASIYSVFAFLHYFYRTKCLKIPFRTWPSARGSGYSV